MVNGGVALDRRSAVGRQCTPARILSGREENAMRPDCTPARCRFRRRRDKMLHRYIAAAVLLSVLVFSARLTAAPAGDSRTYKLAPGDRITITVFNQPELSGDVVIDDVGNIILPFLEPIAVKDLTIIECQRLIRARLADGILQQPTVSVRISELRPLYVMGDVRTPGAYPYRYGSSVQSAVSAAGGFGPPELVPGAAVSEFLLADERVRQLTFQKEALLVREARLQAQRDGMKAFSPPGQAAATNAGTPGLVVNEKDTFATQAAILETQLNVLRSQKPHIQNQIEALNGQVATTQTQLEVVRQYAEQYSRLVKQGLGTLNAEMQSKLAQSTHENELWRLKTEISRLEMGAGDLDVRIEEAAAVFKRQVVTELREVRERLNELGVTLPAAREIRAVRLQYAAGLIKVGVKHSISVSRLRNGETTVFEATETTPVEPGDIIDVKRLLPEQASREVASSDQPKHNFGLFDTPPDEIAVGSRRP
jgi:polysaccharide export outer membrane protein